MSKATELAERFERYSHYIGQDEETATELRRLDAQVGSLNRVNAQLLELLQEAVSLEKAGFHWGSLIERAEAAIQAAKEQA
jgi:hypothetical protein